MWTDGSGDVTRITFEMSSRIKFATGEPASREQVPAETSRKVNFVDGLPQATTPELGCGAHLDRVPIHAQVKTVPELSYEMRSGAKVTVTVGGSACRALTEHCGESNVHGREVGGVLVGYRCERHSENNQREYSLCLTDLIPIRSFDSSSAYITFTEDEWIRAERELGQRYSPEGKCRLGWYHTHPVQGMFFSAQDQRAHEIFKEPHQFALVVDPRSMEAGLFYWSSYEEKILAGPLSFGVRRLGN